jgi:hypothetical protein
MTVAPPQGLEAFASNADGKGAIVVFVSFRNPDGTRAVANVCLRLTGDLRNGFAEPCATDAEFEGMLGDLRANGNAELTTAPPGEIAQMVHEAFARTVAMGASVKDAVRHAVELIERVPPTPPPPLTPGCSTSMETIAALLERPIYDGWVFDAADLIRFGVQPPTAATVRAKMGDTLKALARSPIRERVVAMARYMSRWSAWRGNADEAAEWTTLAGGAETDFTESPLAILMLMRTVFGSGMKAIARSLAKPGAGPQGLVPFASLFPEVAARESRTIVLGPLAGAEFYELSELYCVDPACDCKRVLFRVHSHGREESVATISHGFSAKEARRSGMSQTFLDPLHPKGADADALLAAVTTLLRTDAAWHQRLEDHYALVKGSVAKPVETVRSGSKVGPNEPCPCGSGKKFKKCCRR